MPTTYTISVVTKFENVSEECYGFWLARTEHSGIRKDVFERLRLTGEAGFSTREPHGEGIGTTTYKVERHEAP